MAFARNGDARIYYETFGVPTDPPLLLVNGLGSQCINYRVEWCERFVAAGHFVIRFDNRDVGLSSRFPDTPYTLSDMAADAVAVLDDLAIERAHVMGLSLGGMIVQTMAIEHPDRLLTMTSVMSRTGDADTGRSTEAALQRFMAPAPVDRASYIAASIENLRTWGSPACFDEERIAANAGEAFDRSFDPDGQTRQAKAAMASGSRTEALRTVGVPTLVLHGDADTLIDQSGGRRTAEAIPGARFVLIEGLGHDYPPQYWDQWVELVTAHTHGVPANGG